ncbi:unnamed protein product [Somion occarium]|uniref:Uncharacterized protein n=1 Tax=Somion occarium TaxID=3059160 RepID=A0ABP1E2K2_9APHY
MQIGIRNACARRGLGGFLSTDVSSTPVTDTHFSSSCQQLATAIYASCGLMVIAELLVPLVWLEGCKLERKHGKQRTSWQSEHYILIECMADEIEPFGISTAFVAKGLAINDLSSLESNTDLQETSITLPVPLRPLHYAQNLLQPFNTTHVGRGHLTRSSLVATAMIMRSSCL